MKVFNQKLVISVTSAIVTLVSIGKPLPAQAIGITFDELPSQSVNGLTVQGVTFDFKVNGVISTDATYNSIGPGILTYIQDPSLEGDAAGVLSLDFAKPVSDLYFGVALDSFDQLTSAVKVQLFDKNLASIGIFPVATNPLIDFSEGQFSYSNAVIKRALISFDPILTDRFSLDNLFATEITGNNPPPQSVPEPFTIIGTLIGGTAALRMRRKLKSTSI
jgi:hypothetical protein